MLYNIYVYNLVYDTKIMKCSYTHCFKWVLDFRKSTHDINVLDFMFFFPQILLAKL